MKKQFNWLMHKMKFVMKEQYKLVGGYGYKGYYYFPYFYKPCTLYAFIKTRYFELKLKLIMRRLRKES